MSDFTTLDEVKDIHPITSRYLRDNGYTNIQHHVAMPITGIADFIAKTPNGKILIVECKIDVCFLKKAVRQVMGYRDQYDRASMISVAIPIVGIEDIHRRWCKKHHILLIELDVTTPKPSQKTNGTIGRDYDPSEPTTFVLRTCLTELYKDALVPDDPLSFTNHLKKYLLDNED